MASPVRRHEDWLRLDTALAELSSAVHALRPADEVGASPQPASAAAAPLPSQPASVSAPAATRQQQPAAASSAPPRPSQPASASAAAAPAALARELAPASPKKMPSIFASGHKADLDALKRNVSPNIFAWNMHGGEGVEDDVSSLQLRAASRLRVRQAELLARETEFGLGAVWEVQRQEMREADLFLDAFDRNEAKSFPWPPAVPPAMPCPPTGFQSRLPAQRWPPWHRPTKAEYFNELQRANPAGCSAAVQLGGAEQEMMLREQRRAWEAMARDEELRKWYQQAAR